jgi:preprotein translocase subunit SecA
VCEKLFHIQVRREESESTAQNLAAAKQKPRKVIESGGGTASDKGQAPEDPKPVRRAEPKVGRNDPCPCGSGKKYKKCHGA